MLSMVKSIEGGLAIVNSQMELLVASVEGASYAMTCAAISNAEAQQTN